MKTNFQQRSRRGRSVFIKITLGAAALFVLLFLMPGPLASGLSFITAPLFEARLVALETAAAIPQYFRERALLIAEIEDLREERAEGSSLRAELAALREAHAMINDLKSMNGERIIADVVRTPPETPYDTLVVAAGSDVGIVPGAFVYSRQTAIGQVASVNAKTSLIVLFSTPGSHVPVYLWGAGVFANAEGMGGGVVRVGVPQGLAITVGDAVTLPIPGTAIFGTVDRVESVATNPEQYAYITEETALRSIRFVAIDRMVAPSITPEEAMRAVEMIRSGVVPSPFAPLLEFLPAATSTAAQGTATSTP